MPPLRKGGRMWKLREVRRQTIQCGRPLWAATTECGAGDGTRTRDALLGRQVLYQLSYSRMGHHPERRWLAMDIVA